MQHDAFISRAALGSPLRPLPTPNDLNEVIDLANRDFV